MANIVAEAGVEPAPERRRNRGVRVDQVEAEVWRSVCALLADPARLMNEYSNRADTQRADNEHNA